MCSFILPIIGAQGLRCPAFAIFSGKRGGGADEFYNVTPDLPEANVDPALILRDPSPPETSANYRVTTP